MSITEVKKEEKKLSDVKAEPKNTPLESKETEPKKEQTKKEKKKDERKKKKKQFFADFKKFITRGNVVDMAIGVAVAAAFTAIVKAFTNGFISPILALIGNHADLSTMKWVIRAAVTDESGVETIPEVSILWGGFIQAIIDFLIIAFTLFIILRIVSKLSLRAAKIAEEIKKVADENFEKERLEAEAKAKEKEAAEKAKAKAEAEMLAEKSRTEREFFANINEQNKLLKEIKELLKQVESK
jgi:large conductance mechanosensitive channel